MDKNNKERDRRDWRGKIKERTYAFLCAIIVSVSVMVAIMFLADAMTGGSPYSVIGIIPAAIVATAFFVALWEAVGVYE